jgi:diguanylate cyclase (GGDEF)-like protein
MDKRPRLPVRKRPEAPSEASPVAADARQLQVLNEIARIATADLELRPMLQRITDALAGTFSWPFVALVRLDISRNEFVCEALTSTAESAVHVGYRRELGTGVVGEVAASGKPILIDDVRLHPNYIETMPKVRSELCVPVKHGDRIVAVLNLESPRVAEFSGQLQLLQTVAEQIAGAIASAEMYDELKRRASIMEMMAMVSRIALEALDLQSLVDHVVEYVQQRLGVEVISILLLDETRTEIIQTAHAGRAGVEKGKRWPVTRGITGRSMRTGEPQLVLDVHSDPDYASINKRVTSEFVVPIRFRGEVLGAFNVESTDAAHFTEQRIVGYRALADQLAGAIRLAALNERLERLNAQLSEANARLERISAVDSVTGIANRRRFDDYFEEEWRRTRRNGAHLSLIMIDIDHFKRFNDRYGHQAGDGVLKKVAHALSKELHRAGDLVARYGGEEFVVLLPAADAGRALKFAERLRAGVEAMGIAHEANPSSTRLTISLGVATTMPREKAVTARELVHQADRALYRAKQHGRNRVVAVSS